jgi:hypothetical protein
MKHAVEVDLGAMIYVPSLIKIGRAIRNCIWGRPRHTHSMEIA